MFSRGIVVHPSMASRDVFGCSATMMKDKFMPLFLEKGYIVCKYNDAPVNVTDAKLVHGNIDGIEGAHDVLTVLHDLHPRLAVPSKSVCREMLGMVYREMLDHDESWQALRGLHVNDWKETMVRRIRSLCRIAQQGLCKQKQPKWVKELPFNTKEVDTTEVKTETDDKDKAELKCDKDKAEFTFGFDDELMLPWRKWV